MDVNYAFYPTLLDSYRYYLDNIEDETNFYELIDKINKVKKETNEEQAKGIAFETCVNDFILGKTEIIPNVFDPEIIAKIANKLSKAKGLQVFKEKVIETKNGKVRLYGIFDYEFPEMIADLKTTKSYKSCKYVNNFQHKFISLMDLSTPYFSYVVTDFNYMFVETYRLDNKLQENALKEIEDFIEFLERNKSLITDFKVFGV